ncbi:hypothetical protein ACWC4J_42040, partial [Streptomyces sp. NPDC001356]
MLGLELVVLLGLATLLGNVLSKHLRITPPVVLLVAGVLLGFIPALREVHLRPDTRRHPWLPPSPRYRNPSPRSPLRLPHRLH